MYIDMPEPKTGMEKNLFEQLHLVMTHARQGSLETRRRYASAGFRFLRWLAGRFRTKRLANMDRKHLECYAAYLKDEELAAKTIETELSALRWIHSQVSAPTNKIRKGPGSNLALGVGHDSRMGVHREWTSDELDEMADLAAMSGRQDVAILIRLASATGLRLNEICGLRRHQAESALRGKYLRVKGKNGKVRDIPVNAEASLLLLKAVQGVKRGWYLFCPEDKSIPEYKADVGAFIRRHRDAVQDEERGESAHNVRAGDKAALSMHGLRYKYVQDEYRRLVSSGKPPEDAQLQVMKQVGHERRSEAVRYGVPDLPKQESLFEPEDKELPHGRGKIKPR